MAEASRACDAAGSQSRRKWWAVVLIRLLIICCERTAGGGSLLAVSVAVSVGFRLFFSSAEGIQQAG